MAPGPEPAVQGNKKKIFPTWPDGPAKERLPVLHVPHEAMWNPVPNHKLSADSHLHRHGCSARNITWNYLHGNGTLPRPYADCPLAPVFLTQRKCRKGRCKADRMMHRYSWFDWDGLGDPCPAPTLAARSEPLADQSPESLLSDGRSDSVVIAEKAIESLLGLFVLLILVVFIKKMFGAFMNKRAEKKDAVEPAIEMAATDSEDPERYNEK